MKINQQCFVKDFGSEQNRHGFDREIVANKLFVKFSTPILEVDYEKRKIYYKKIDQQGDFNNQDLYKIGEVLNLVHKKCSFGLDYWPNGLLNKYSTDLELLNMLKRKKDKITKIKGGFIHGDYRLRNILKTKKGVKIVDWEYFGVNFIYWDIAILIADLRHRQYHGELENLDSKHFFEGYGKGLSEEEKDFCMCLGAIDIIFDHLFPDKDEKCPIPKNLFDNFCNKEKKFLIH